MTTMNRNFWDKNAERYDAFSLGTQRPTSGWFT